MIGSELSYWELALQGDGQALWIPIALVGFTLALVGWALVAAPRVRRPFVLLGTATAMTVQAGLLVGVLVWILRAQDYAWAIAGPRAEAAWDVIPLLGQDRMIQLATVLLALVVPGLLLAWGRVLPRLRPVFASVAAVSFGAALSTFWMSTARIDGALRSLVDGQPSGYHERIAALDLAVWIPAAVAGVALVGLVLWRRRSGPWTRSWKAPVVAGLAFVTGLAAFVSTRANANDRHLVLSMGDATYLLEGAPLAPGGMQCRDVGIAPIARIDHDMTRLDGRRLDLVHFGQDLETLRRNWYVLHPREVFPGTLIVIAPRTLTWPELEPWLAVAHEAGYTQAMFVARGSRLVHTDTLGLLSRPVPCGVPVTLSPYIDSYEYPRYPPGPGFASDRWRDVGEMLGDAVDGELGYAYLRSLTAAW